MVKSARHLISGERVAVKIIDKIKLDKDSVDRMYNEVEHLKVAKHASIVQLYEAIDTPNSLYLILERADKGDLYDFIMENSTILENEEGENCYAHERQTSGIGEALARRFFKQISEALYLCHSNNIVHRDLKPENVVIFTDKDESTKLRAKITDFGFSNKFNPETQLLSTSCGSLAYSAPEVLLGDEYIAPAVDVWSLGVLLYMLVCGKAPFNETNDSETLTCILDCKFEIPPYVNPDCQHLIKSMIRLEPTERLTMGQVLNSSWVTQNESIPAVLSTEPVLDQPNAEEFKELFAKLASHGFLYSNSEVFNSVTSSLVNPLGSTCALLLLQIRKQRRRKISEGKTPPTGNSRPASSLQLKIDMEIDDKKSLFSPDSFFQNDEPDDMDDDDLLIQTISSNNSVHTGRMFSNMNN